METRREYLIKFEAELRHYPHLNELTNKEAEHVIDDFDGDWDAAEADQKANAEVTKQAELDGQD